MSTLKVGTIQSTTGNTGLTIANDGTVLPKACAFQMTPTSVQTIANQTDTTFYFNTAGIDTHSITDVSNNRVVITTATAGLWFLSFVYRLENVVPFRQSATIKKNGNVIAVFQATQWSQTTIPDSSTKVDTLVNLANGDVLTFHAWHGHGATQSTSDDSFDNTTTVTFGVNNRAEGFRIGTL
tara:strand:+ start:5649 stop:6194 length:546 start_codon:yes stop_codon:yes gene_type:complete